MLRTRNRLSFVKRQQPSVSHHHAPINHDRVDVIRFR
jgi:hypothetical protein